jgi:hypothetical protein
MPLHPSRRDTIGPPPRDDVSNLAALVRHQGSYLRQLDPGILGGTRATPRPVGKGVSPIVGGDGGGDDTTYEWQWDDRHLVTATGTQRPVLTYEPVEESLVVRWHPAGRGGLPITNEHFTVDGRVVTIPDPGVLAVGDQFSFQYQFDPVLSDAGDAFAGMTLRDVTSYYNPSGHPTSLALPGGTQVGDLIVLGTVGFLDVVTDPRLAQVDVDTWVGVATDLTPVLVTSGANYWAAEIATFDVGGAAVGNIGATVGTSTPAGLPVVAGQGGIAVITSGFGLINGSSGLPSGGYSSAGGSGPGKNNAQIAYWYDLTALATPVSAATITDVVGWNICVIGFGA